MFRDTLLAIAALAEGYAVENADPYRDMKARGIPPDPADDLAQNPGAIFKRTAVGSGPCMGPEKFMQEVAMAVLDVDEVEAQLPGVDGARDEALDEIFDLGVFEDRRIVCNANAGIQQRVTKGDPWLEAAVFSGPGESSRVG